MQPRYKRPSSSIWSGVDRTNTARFVRSRRSSFACRTSIVSRLALKLAVDYLVIYIITIVVDFQMTQIPMQLSSHMALAISIRDAFSSIQELSIFLRYSRHCSVSYSFSGSFFRSLMVERTLFLLIYMFLLSLNGRQSFNCVSSSPQKPLARALFSCTIKYSFHFFFFCCIVFFLLS